MESVGKVNVAPGVDIPERVEFSTDHAGVRLHLILEAEYGKLVCRSLRIDQLRGGPPVTTELFGHLPLSTIIREHASKSLVPEFDPEVAANGPTDEAIRAAATVYRYAYALGLRPTQTVAEKLNLTHPTAARWISRARDKGILAPTIRGKPGEMVVATRIAEDEA